MTSNTWYMIREHVNMHDQLIMSMPDQLITCMHDQVTMGLHDQLIMHYIVMMAHDQMIIWWIVHDCNDHTWCFHHVPQKLEAELPGYAAETPGKAAELPGHIFWTPLWINDHQGWKNTISYMIDWSSGCCYTSFESYDVFASRSPFCLRIVMTCPLQSQVFSSETLVAGCAMVASGGQPPQIETSEDELLEEIQRLEALMIIYRQHLFITKIGFFVSIWLTCIL